MSSLSFQYLGNSSLHHILSVVRTGQLPVSCQDSKGHRRTRGQLDTRKEGSTVQAEALAWPKTRRLEGVRHIPGTGARELEGVNGWQVE